MDIGTRIIISMFFFSTLIILSVRYFKQRSYQMLASLFSVVWIVIVAGGEFTYNWAGNAMCSPYLGCVSGFFGYDAFEHFFFGVAALMILFWFCEKFPQHSLLPEVRWKRILISLALIALVAVSWEIVECAHDAIRADVFHESLRNFIQNLGGDSFAEIDHFDWGEAIFWLSFLRLRCLKLLTMFI